MRVRLEAIPICMCDEARRVPEAGGTEAAAIRPLRRCGVEHCMNFCVACLFGYILASLLLL